MSEPPQPPSFRLVGRTAMVTGANTGLGKAIAIALAGAGADIVLVGRSSMTDTAEAIAALGRNSLALYADLAEVGRLGGLVAQAEQWRGQLDILVNNAGIIRRADAVELSELDWDAVIDTNLKSLFFLSQAAAKQMLSRGSGKIINIASLLAFQGGVRVAAYTASKSGVAGLTRLMACEWAARGVNVNAIAPGYFETNNTESLRNDAARRDSILSRIPAGHWGQSHEIGGAAVFLASEASAYVHGIVLPVDGGWLAR